MTRDLRSERGSALVIAMLLVVVLGVVTTRMTGTASRAAIESTLARGSLEARLAAEGGIDTARVRLALDPAWKGDTIEVGRCSVVVEVRCQDDGRIDVDATSTCPVRGSGLPVRSTVAVQLRRDGSGVRTSAWTER